ncbi:MAG: glycoside hydrolase family 28 protein [Acidobacteria bacterium]|nr:glycoside hydrolase family 28 protein [Acidobacteriota bacterium]
MTNKNHEGISTSKRQALHKMFGIGAGLVTADLLLPNASPAAGLGLPQMPGATVDPSAKGVYNVRAMGATGDGKTVDTPAINKTIEAAARAGGGTVLFPAGTYLCFSIHLKSNVALYLDRGATILAGETGQGGNYDAAEPNPEAGHYEDYGHRHWHNALLWGVGLENISILGPGLIWGKGLTRGPGQENPGVGDKSISLKNCHNVTIRDVSVLQGGHFCILATGVDNFTIENVILDTNRDGIDIDCCHNVRVSNMTVNSPWDDGICLKSSYALGYPRSTENLTLTNCFVTGGYELGTVLDGTFKHFPAGQRPFPTGRIKFGTESNGGFQNITISNSVFDNCRGLALETVDGALLEDVSISNITMRGISDLPIFMRLGSRMRGPAGRPIGQLRRVSISNIVASNTNGRYCSILSGIPGHEIEDVRLSDIIILSQGGGTPADAAIKPPEKANGYPEPTMFGPMPAYGFYIRHVKGLQMNNIEVRTMKEDTRPAFILDDVERADFINIKMQRAPAGRAFRLENVQDFSIYLSRPIADTHLENVKEKNI